jgi:dTMP kinase
MLVFAQRTKHSRIAIKTMKGLFVTFEGTEGCGKSTQMKLLQERLLSAGHPNVLALREPGGTAIGEEIRHTAKHSRTTAAMSPETELLLMNASRAQLVRELIRPALDAGRIVLCDRFYDSSTAYQGYGRGLDLKFVRDVIEFAVGGTRPNLTVLLRVPSNVSADRLHARRSRAAVAPDRIENEDDLFFQRVAAGYEAISAAEPERVRAVNATGEPNTVGAAIWNLVRPMLPTAP